ncbi:unnamed protein product [Lupinus luteus]|uniref:Uncharacterized protein n=1 Tax=Lupinus luteus TaxID=3873 RepID=A0AAV1WEB8_LUPLU
MSFRVLCSRTMTHEDGSIRTLDSFNQVLTDHQPREIHRSSRTILQTNHKISFPNNSILQNSNHNYPNPRNFNQAAINFMSAHHNYLNANNSISGTNFRIQQGHRNYPTLNDFIQGSSYGNGGVGATTRTIVPLVTYSSDNGYTMLAATNGALTLLYLPKDPPPNIGSNTVSPTLPSHVASAGNSSLNNNVSVQGDTTSRETEQVVIDLNEGNEDNIDLSLHL